MTGSGHRVTAIEIEVLLAVAGVDPNVLTAFDCDGHFLVRGELKLFLDRFNHFEKNLSRLWVRSHEHQTRLFIQPKHQIHILHRLPSGAFNQIVDC